jgi:hypothetical protein
MLLQPCTARGAAAINGVPTTVRVDFVAVQASC